MTKTYDFAGEEVKVTETVPSNASKVAEQTVTKSDASARLDNQETKKPKLVVNHILYRFSLID